MQHENSIIAAPLFWNRTAYLRLVLILVQDTNDSSTVLVRTGQTASLDWYRNLHESVASLVLPIRTKVITGPCTDATGSVGSASVRRSQSTSLVTRYSCT